MLFSRTSSIAFSKAPPICGRSIVNCVVVFVDPKLRDLLDPFDLLRLRCLLLRSLDFRLLNLGMKQPALISKVAMLLVLGWEDLRQGRHSLTSQNAQSIVGERFMEDLLESAWGIAHAEVVAQIVRHYIPELDPLGRLDLVLGDTQDTELSTLVDSRSDQLDLPYLVGTVLRLGRRRTF